MKTKAEHTAAGRILFAALVIGLCSITLYFAASRRSILGYDGEAYIETAEKGLEDPAYLRGNKVHRPPFYPILLMLSFSLFGKSLLAVHFFPLIFMLLSPLLCFLLLRRICGSRWWALFGAAALLFFPNSRAMMCQYPIMPVSVFLILCSMLLLDMMSEKKKYLLLPLFACLASLSTLKFELISVSLIFAACGVYRCLGSLRFNRRKMIWAAGLAIAAFCVLYFILLLTGKSGFLPDRLTWQFSILQDNMGKSANRIYMYDDFTSMFRKNTGALFSYPVPMIILILLGAVYAVRLNRKYLLWYLLFPIILYTSIYFTGFGRKMIRFASPATPIFCLFIVLGIMFIFRMAGASARQPFQTAWMLALAGVVVPLLFLSYRQADLTWQADSLYQRDVASAWTLLRCPVRIPSYRERRALKRRGMGFSQELHNYINGFFRNPLTLAPWRLRCDGQSLKIDTGEKKWRDSIHRVEINGQPVETWNITYPGVQEGSRETEIIFHLLFNRPIHTLHYLDRHETPEKRDSIQFSISPDGKRWRTVYQARGERWLVTWGAHFRKGFSGRRDVFLKYRFQADHLPEASGGRKFPRLREIHMAADFSPCPPLYGEDWLVDRHQKGY